MENKEEYLRESNNLACETNIYDNCSEENLKGYGITACNYLLMIARLEPENNLEIMGKTEG